MTETASRYGRDHKRRDWGESRSKTVVWHDPMITAAAGVELSGLEFLRAIRDGLLPPPPIAVLFGFEIREVEIGLVVFECVPDESAYNPIGVVHGGLVCTLADTVAACAVHTTLDAGTAYTSIDLNVSYLRAVTKTSGLLRATGHVTKPGRRVAFCAARIVDGEDKLVATATSTCLIMDGESRQ
ncbi:MAG: PaaI family thioesterase [Acidimicrobiales bacterium]